MSVTRGRQEQRRAGGSGTRLGVGLAALACVGCCLPLLAAAAGGLAAGLAAWAGGVIAGAAVAGVAAALVVVRRRRRSCATSSVGDAVAGTEPCSCCTPAVAPAVERKPRVPV